MSNQVIKQIKNLIDDILNTIADLNFRAIHFIDTKNNFMAHFKSLF